MNKFNLHYIHIFSSSVIILIFVGCFNDNSSSISIENTKSYREALVDKGAMKIDPANPYLAAGQLIEAEKNQSKVFSGFLSIRGEPSAIEVIKEKNNKLGLKIYYTDLFERYDLTPTDDDWAIAGPFPDQSIPRNTSVLDTPSTVTTPVQSNKLAEVTPKAWPSKTSINEQAEFEVTNIPTSTDTPIVDSKNFIANESIDKNKDLTHIVQFHGETISMITRWYTNEVSNAAKIARLNSMKNADQLSIGDKIIIPSYMVKKRDSLTQDAVNQYLNN